MDGPVEPFVYPVLKYRVIDGDTVEVVIDRGWTDTKTVSVRWDGWDAPEKRTTAGQVITNVVSFWLTERKTDLFMRSIARDKFEGRVVGELFPQDQRSNTLTVFLRDLGMMKEMEGGGDRRPEWSDAELERALAAAQETIEERRYMP